MARQSRLRYITIDVNDMPTAVKFWSQALGATPEGQSDTFQRLVVPDSSVGIFLQLVPEPKTAKTRMHLDLVATNPTEEVERLVKLGAKVIRPLPKAGFQFAVLSDPFENEFCVLPE
ncbi:MAG TPA: VOC family protein [Candidatus Saccharimonadales bacterium]|nr:VOC family protein [Candidatus Saccharimonadales bacterium]